MKLSKQIRIVALGVALTCSAVGMPALHAFAATPHGTGPLHQPVPTKVTRALPVQGGSTGEGPYGPSDCANIAEYINLTLDDAQTELQTKGMTPRWYWLMSDAQSARDSGVENGCFFVNDDF